MYYFLHEVTEHSDSHLNCQSRTYLCMRLTKLPFPHPVVSNVRTVMLSLFNPNCASRL